MAVIRSQCGWWPPPGHAGALTLKQAVQVIYERSLHQGAPGALVV